MRLDITNIPFEQWVFHIFDRRVSDPAWYWDEEAGWWYGTPQETVHFITRLFENSGSVLEPFSDAQLNQGLWFLASNACSGYMFAFLDDHVDLQQRLHGLSAVIELYRQCFQARCTPHLSHLDEPGAGPLNAVCYMWFDLIPIYAHPNDPSYQAFDQQMLAVMSDILRIDSASCQEGALHGLGHWYSAYPQQVEALIDAYIKRNPSLRTELKQYAFSAKRGCVL